MENFTIGLDAGNDKVIAHIEPIEDTGIMRYKISVAYFTSAVGDKGWAGIIEHDADGWKQTRESIEKGPILPCFLVEEIGEQIEQHFK